MAQTIVALVIASVTLLGAGPIPAQGPNATELSQIREILEQARKTALQPIPLQVPVLTKIAGVQVEAGDRSNARTTLEKILVTLEANPNENQWYLARIAVLQAKNGDFDEALKIAGPSRFPADSGPDKAIGQIAVLQAESGNVQRAFQIVQGIKYSNVKGEALARIAFAQAVAGDFATARSTFRQALRAVRWQWYRYVSILPDLLSAPGTRDSAEWTFTTIATLQAKAGDTQGALVTAEGIRFRFRTHALTKIALVQAARGDTPGARETLQRALESAEAVQDEPQVQSYALLSVGRAQRKVGEQARARLTLQRAIQAATRIDYAHSKAVAIAEIGEAQAESGDAANARLTLTLALQAADALRGHPGGLWWDALGKIAQSQARAGDIEGALRTLKAITGFAPLDKEDALIVIAKVQAERGDIKGAIQTAASDPWALRAVASTQAKAGDVAGVLSWAANVNSPDAKAFGLLGAAEGILSRSEPKCCRDPLESDDED